MEDACAETAWTVGAAFMHGSLLKGNFSEGPYLSGTSSTAEVRGIQERGVVAYVKHFAFNEEETNRNGMSVWLNEQSAREIYLLPFE